MAETSALTGPYHLDTPLSFVSQRPCIWYTGHGRSEAKKRLTNSKSRATGGNDPADNRPIVGRSLISILKDSRKSRNSFPGIEKKNRLETLKSR